MPFYIKYTDTDVPIGAPAHVTRPIPAGTRYWESPSIWFTDPAGMTLAAGKPKVHVPCQIRVRVDPNGPPLARLSHDINVQVWVCDFTVGVGPAGVRTGQSFTINGKVDTPLDDDSLSPFAVVAAIDWTPLPGDLFNPLADGTFHMCVGANAYLPGVEGAELAPAGMPAPVPLPNIDVVHNPHHGQLNMAIISAAGKGGAKLKLGVFNPGAKKERFIVEATAVRKLGTVERAQLLALPYVVRAGGRPFDPEEILGRPGLPGEPLERLELRRGGKLVLAKGKAPLRTTGKGLAPVELSDGQNHAEGKLTLDLDPAEPGKPRFIDVRLRLRDAKDVGQVEAVDIVQRRSDDTPVGGGRVLLFNAGRDIDHHAEA